jgi:hypothetical protein
MNRCRKAAQILLEMLREIFDEASYGRFLERSGLTSSPAAYDRFCRERETAHARRARCC